MENEDSVIDTGKDIRQLDADRELILKCKFMIDFSSRSIECVDMISCGLCDGVYKIRVFR